MKKPLNYYGYAYEDCKKDYNKKYLKTKAGKKTIKKCKENKKRLRKKLKKNGIDISETWNLNISIAKYIIPRIKLFKNNLHSYPYNLTLKEWKNILKKILKAYKLILKDNRTEEDHKKIKQGLNLYSKYYLDLWD